MASAREHRADSAEAAVAAAERLGFPVVLKVDSPDLPHKTEAGVIRLGLKTEAEVREAYAAVMANAARAAPTAAKPAFQVENLRYFSLLRRPSCGDQPTC